MSENAKNGSREIETNGGLMNASCGSRAIRAIEDLATETAVNENVLSESVLNENVLSENVPSGNVENANVDHAAIAEKDEIAARAAAVAADRQRQSGKDRLFDKCIRRRIRRQLLRMQSRVRRAQATQSKAPSPPLGGGSRMVR